MPLSTVQTLSQTFGPQFTNRFNVYRAVLVTGAAAPGYSSGQAMTALEEVARETLPATFSYDWADCWYCEDEDCEEAIGEAIRRGVIVVAAALAAGGWTSTCPARGRSAV